MTLKVLFVAVSLSVLAFPSVGAIQETGQGPAGHAETAPRPRTLAQRKAPAPMPSRPSLPSLPAPPRPASLPPKPAFGDLLPALPMTPGTSTGGDYKTLVECERLGSVYFRLSSTQRKDLADDMRACIDTAVRLTP